MNNFSQFDISQDFISILDKMGISSPTKIQEVAIPLLTENKNVFFEAETGSGKTLAFLLPAMNKVLQEFDGQKQNPQILILSPTIELASQIKKEAQNLAQIDSRLKTFLAVGGSPLKRQLEGLKTKPQIIVGNPGRITNLLTSKKLKLNNLQTIVFDEADRILANENIKYIEAIIQALPDENIQCVACSATFKNKSTKLLSELLTKKFPTFQFEYEKVNEKEVLQKAIEHWAIFSEDNQKAETLKSFIKALPPESKILIFTSPARNVANLVKKLNWKKVDAEGLFTDYKNQERQSIIDRFKSGKIKILVTSDLATRGLDIPNIDYVVQMNVPRNEDFYIHRAGRTGRAGKKGVSVCIGNANEMYDLKRLEKKLELVVYPKTVYHGEIHSN